MTPDGTVTDEWCICGHHIQEHEGAAMWCETYGCDCNGFEGIEETDREKLFDDK